MTEDVKELQKTVKELTARVDQLSGLVTDLLVFITDESGLTEMALEDEMERMGPGASIYNT